MKHEIFRSLSAAREVCAEPQEGVPAVYFLYAGDRLVYVGKSINPAQRVKSHNVRGWDSVVVLPIPAESLDEVERAMIGALQPPWNRDGVDLDKREPRPRHPGYRSEVIRVLLDEGEQAELQAAADKAALPLAVWARQAIILKSREVE